LAGFEIAANELYRLIVGNHLPKTRRIKEGKSYDDSIASEQLTNYQPLGESKQARRFFIESNFQDFGRILLAGLFLQENDLHEGNCGICEDAQGNIRIVKIDGDQAFFAKFTGFLANFSHDDVKQIRVAKESSEHDINGVSFLEGFGINHQDLAHITKIGGNIDPHELKTSEHGATARYLPYNSVCYGIENKRFNKALQKIEQTKSFQAEKFLTFLKIYMLPKVLIKSIVDHAIENTDDRGNLFESLVQNQEIWLRQTLKVDGFKAYIHEHGIAAFAQIQQEIQGFLKLKDNALYLASSNPTASCYDEHMQERFKTVVSVAGFAYEVLQQEQANIQQQQALEEIAKTADLFVRIDKQKPQTKPSQQIRRERALHWQQTAEKAAENLNSESSLPQKPVIVEFDNAESKDKLAKSKHVTEAMQNKKIKKHNFSNPAESSSYQQTSFQRVVTEFKEKSRLPTPEASVNTADADVSLQHFYQTLAGKPSLANAKVYFTNEIQKFDSDALLALGEAMQAMQKDTGSVVQEIKNAFNQFRQPKTNCWVLFDSNKGNTADWQDIFSQLKQTLMLKLERQATKDSSGSCVLDKKTYNQAHAIMSQRTGKFLSSFTLCTGTNYSKFLSDFTLAGSEQSTENSLVLLSRANLRR
jgi:hypothetical protein